MKKKILIIHHSGILGGAGISLYNTWKKLNEDYEVTCYIPNDPPDLLNYLNSKNMFPKTFDFRLGKITYYSGGNKVYNWKLWYHALHSVTQLNYWKEVLKKEKPDLVIVNSKVLCWMSLIFKKYNIKSICFVRETIPGNPEKGINKIMKKFLENFSGVAFLTEYDMKITNLNIENQIVSPDFLIKEDYLNDISQNKALEKFKLPNKNDNNFFLLFVGGTDPIKGLKVLVNALVEMKNKDIHLIIAGNNLGDFQVDNIKNFLKFIKLIKARRYSKVIKSIIEKNNLSNQVHFVGSQKKMSDLYIATDILIFPMEEPHQPRPVFEIGLFKKTAIITDFINIQDYYHDKKNCLLFLPHNHQSLSNKVIELKSNPDLRARLGETNSSYTQKYHNDYFAISEFKKLIIDVI